MKAILKKEKEKSILRKHPWIFSGAIDKIEGVPTLGDTIEVCDSKKNFLGLGQFSPHSQIRIRIISFKYDIINMDFFHKRIHESILRRGKDLAGNSAARLIFSESDLLPGLIVDSYAGHFVVQYQSAGMERWKDEINEILLSHEKCKSLYERCDSGSRQKEGLEKRNAEIGKQPTPDFIEFQEGAIKFLVDVKRGHKTGFYLDQQSNRELVLKYAAGAEILNCFSYTGGFGLSAMVGGAKNLINIESSSDSLSLLEKNFNLNNVDSSKIINQCSDVFETLRLFKKEDRKFDLIILDPPKFAESAQQVLKAARGYKDINRLAFELLNPMGVLFTFSCSGHISPALFQKIVADAAVDAKRDAQIIERMSQHKDHPVLLSFPESEYLKGFICRAI